MPDRVTKVEEAVARDPAALWEEFCESLKSAGAVLRRARRKSLGVGDGQHEIQQHNVRYGARQAILRDLRTAKNWKQKQEAKSHLNTEYWSSNGKRPVCGGLWISA